VAFVEPALTGSPNKVLRKRNASILIGCSVVAGQAANRRSKQGLAGTLTDILGSSRSSPAHTKPRASTVISLSVSCISRSFELRLDLTLIEREQCGPWLVFRFSSRMKPGLPGSAYHDQATHHFITVESFRSTNTAANVTPALESIRPLYRKDGGRHLHEVAMRRNNPSKPYGANRDL
jgi:hypothetical protein